MAGRGGFSVRGRLGTREHGQVDVGVADHRHWPGARASLGFCVEREVSMVKVALLVRLVAKPGKEEEVAAFLTSALPLAQAEPATIVWFALRLSKSEFGIFDAFPDDAGRKAHLNGPIAAALMAKAGALLAEPPKIEQVELLASKLAK
jgi:quinol monooxygenase YgiN